MQERKTVYLAPPATIFLLPKFGFSLFDSKVGVIGSFAGLVFVNEVLNGFPAVVKLIEVVGEFGFAFVGIDKGVAFLNDVVLLEEPFKELGHARVVGQGKAADLVGPCHKGVAAGQRHLDRGRSPRNEPNELSFTYPLQGLVNLGRVNIVALNNVEHGNVTTGPGVGRNHGVFGLGQPPHDIQHGCFAHSRRRRRCCCCCCCGRVLLWLLLLWLL